jgi:hypothetical protein
LRREAPRRREEGEGEEGARRFGGSEIEYMVQYLVDAILWKVDADQRRCKKRSARSTPSKALEA